MKRMSFLYCLFFTAAVSAVVLPHPWLIADAGDFEYLKVGLATTELGNFERGIKVPDTTGKNGAVGRDGRCEWSSFVIQTGGAAVEWLVLWFLYEKKTFLKV